MSHFAKLDSNNVITEVIVSEKDFINSGLVGDEFVWVQTSYNNNFRGRYAGVGYTWNKVNEVFISPQPYPSWSLDSNYTWQAPVNPPPVTEGMLIHWDEDTLSWLETTTTL